jgi:hypothetical protein
MTAAFDLEAAWRPYETLVPTATLAGWMERPVSFIRESPIAIIPSTILAPDGVRLDSFFIVTVTFLSEVWSGGQKFDVVLRRNVRRMEWSFGSTEVERPEVPKVKYETVSLKLDHTQTHAGNETNMHYVGESSAGWVSLVRGVMHPGFLVP